ncbi:probable serine/threonine-protein kinase DDB_G0271682 isoform X2 [Trifolium pratense]|uniref:probable serine/threonine-protein kinase DDB_G0271682 isoform X2 n=1 Tax=Trifolium pratense TaxID=57577 RepID=UPI001E692817|nr:probable serine/threonine-protein kinase DDB_G0271682 isoform X2 [Trifolium pratense]
MGGEEKENCAYQVLVDRLRILEEKQAILTEQFSELLQEKKLTVKENEDSTADFLAGFFFFSQSPYAKILKCIGISVYVHSVSSGEITYWNNAAETLYGWKEHEVIGQRIADFLVAEEYYASLRKILQQLITGVPWYGQFPFKKRSGEIFMALVTKTPLYEDGVLVGIISVSSDAAVVNSKDFANGRTCQSRANDKPGTQRLKRVQWPPRPQIASSVSNLASKFLPPQRTDDSVSKNTSTDSDDEKQWKPRIYETESCSRSHQKENTAAREPSTKDESTTELSQPSKIAAKVLSKFRIGGSGKCRKDAGSIKDNCPTEDNSGSNTVNNENDLSGNSVALTWHQDISNGQDKEENLQNCNSSFVVNNADAKFSALRTSSVFKDSSAIPFSENYCECSGSPSSKDPLRLHCSFDPKKLESRATNLVIEDEVKKQQEGLQLASSKESTGGHAISLSKGKSESNSVVECEIQWKDLQLRKEIGQGSYAVVYHGIWNASDVAVKVYFANGYTEETLQDYKKEVDIMKRLRHPNVLLFMGAIYSQKKHAIVTELLPRGSLFRTLHKNNQTFDIRRHLRMALDVARGMNYLHHRNPPIVHRDLKSSNLLVDKNWNVKVGDFGLSKLKDATLLTTKSGRGTPQWMAPEVLRSEPSNEKSDVFSYGVVLWEIMTQSIPWKDLNSLQVVGIVGFMDRRLDLPEGLDPHVASIINDCWQSDPEQRPSFEELIQRMMLAISRVTTLSLNGIAES